MKETGKKELEQLKYLSLKISEATLKRSAAITEKKKKIICQTNHIYQLGTFTLTLKMIQPFSVMFQL